MGTVGQRDESDPFSAVSDPHPLLQTVTRRRATRAREDLQPLKFPSQHWNGLLAKG